MLELAEQKAVLIKNANLYYNNEKYSFEEFKKRINSCTTQAQLEHEYYVLQTDDDMMFDVT
jgi:hypothetical protein